MGLTSIKKTRGDVWLDSLLGGLSTRSSISVGRPPLSLSLSLSCKLLDLAMAEAATPTLSEQYLLKKEEKVEAVTKPTEEPEVNTPNSETVEVEAPKTEENPVVSEEADSFATTVAEESNETTPNEESATEESNGGAEEVESGDQEEEEKPEVKLETAPADYRFPTTNQTRHCFTRYIEYHRCVAAKGDDASECDKFAKYYRALCPGEWVDKWNEQRENGTFPGPL